MLCEASHPSCKLTATEAESEENNKKAEPEEKEAESEKLLVTCEPEQLTQDNPSAEEEQKSMGNIFSSTSPAGVIKYSSIIIHKVFLVVMHPIFLPNMLAKYLYLLEVEVARKSQHLIVLQMGLFSQKVFKILVLQGWK